MICFGTVFEGGGTKSGERSSKSQDETSDSHKLGGKNQQEVIHWHNRYVGIVKVNSLTSVVLVSH